MKRSVLRFLIVALITTMFSPLPSKVKASGALPEANVVWVNGAPFINVDGVNYAPMMLFINADVELAPAKAKLEAELEFADREDVKFVSVNLTFPWRSSDSGTRSWYYSKINTWLSFIAETYPNAYIIPRIWLGSHIPDLLADPSLDSERIAYTNQTKENVLSLGSAEWQSGMVEAIEDGIAHIEANPIYAQRVIGYHLAYGDGGEWFQYHYREYGNDVSPANKAAFRAWLLDKYGGEAQWAAAWGLSAIGPNDPVIHKEPSTANKAFLESVVNQDDIDFNAFTSDLVADSIIKAASAVKRVTMGKKLAMAFYGYLFELVDANSGHLGLKKVLAAGDIDMLASPVSYFDRGVGGIGSHMTTVDSVALHHKLWMIEDDSRTYLSEITPQNFPTAELTIEGHKRNISSAIVHRTGLWFMDLSSNGWLNDSSMWENIGNMQQFYKEYMQTAQPLKPDVAFIVDEQSMQYMSAGRQINSALLFNQRTNIYRSGLSYGMYLLEDILNGAVPDAKMYVFLNAHVLDTNERNQLNQLKNANRTFVWVYGADIIDTSALGAATGFTLSKATNVSPSSIIKINANASGPWSNLAGVQLALGLQSGSYPFFTISSPGSAAVIGRYGTSSTGQPAIVAQDFGTWKSVFVGSGNLDVNLLRAIADYAGVHKYMDAGDVLQTDKTFFSIHASSAGIKTLKLPVMSNVRDAFSGVLIGDTTDTVTFTMSNGETRWLVLEKPTAAKKYKFSNGFDLAAKGFTYSGYNSTFNTSTGVLEATVTNSSLGTGPILITPANLGVDADDNPHVNIRIRNVSGASVSRIYWTTDTSTSFGEDKTSAIAIGTNMGSYTNYSFDLSNHPNWSGTLNQLRFDLITGPGIVNGSKVYVDYVEIASKPPFAAERFTFATGFDLGAKGFTYSGYNASFNTSTGPLEVTVTNSSLGAGPILITPGRLGINAADHHYVNIRIRNLSGASSSRIYWTTGTSPTFGEDKASTISIGTNMGGYTNYSFDLSSNPNWAGMLDQLRFDLITGPGIVNGSKVYVDYVEIASAP
ncbi:hypothetical protein Back11_62990 [Paenibacillus baekrokdamisoli]|uniref:Uncharacterized protein n=1 Tax=Paenibacillus baekrokdamisoli TaxID=1712516 RepID=A0A3G9JQ47_9BACL|nr:hypothetical protein [Paenibacillus baekrokdamisoli]MBB3069472.1 hypothetical protein [Paenibacillus baekrokdamisoli]BBH24954.1 hypothetical protein Back11_62990 [Paenibacillus baekrokdamisoli]